VRAWKERKKEMRCEESDWIGILATVLFTGVMTVLPLPESKYLSIPISFAQLYALLLLVTNFYFILYISAWFSASTNDTIGAVIPFFVFILTALLTWLKRAVIALIAFFVSNAITAWAPVPISILVSIVVSIIVSVLVKRFLEGKAASDIFLYLINAVLLVFSVMAVTPGAPGSARNREPPNFYILCNVQYGAVTILDNIVNQTLLVFYILGAMFVRVMIVSCYEMCAKCNNKNKGKKKATELTTPATVNSSTTITINSSRRTPGGYGKLATDSSSGEGDQEEVEVEVEEEDEKEEKGVALGAGGLRSTADGDVVGEDS
jgi:hypothetical protein